MLWKGRLVLSPEPEETRLFCMRQIPDGSWSVPKRATDAEAVGVGAFAAISNAPNEIQILWTDFREKHLKWPGGPLFDGVPKLFGRALEGGVLGPVSRITKKSRDFVGDVRIASHSAGMLYALWSENAGSADEGDFLSTRSEGAWSRPLRVTDWKPRDARYSHFGKSNLVVLPSGKVMIFWRREAPYSDIRYRAYKAGNLGPIETIAPKSCCPDVAVSSDGTIHLVFMDEVAPLSKGRWSASLQRHTLYYQARKAGQWTERQKIAKQVFWGTAHVAVSSSDKVNVFWQELSGKHFLFRHASGALITQKAGKVAE